LVVLWSIQTSYVKAVELVAKEKALKLKENKETNT
jgi:hypothetical protein